MEMYDYMLENFKLYSTEPFENFVHCYQSDYHEITAEKEDGSRIIYNDLDKTICYIPNRDIDKMNACDWKKAFSRKMYRLIRNRGMTQKYLSELTGIPEATISSYMKGNSMPSAQNVRLLAKAFEIPIDKLYDF